MFTQYKGIPTSCLDSAMLCTDASQHVLSRIEKTWMGFQAEGIAYTAGIPI
jgi:hypothetical protein